MEILTQTEDQKRAETLRTEFIEANIEQHRFRCRVVPETSDVETVWNKSADRIRRTDFGFANISKTPRDHYASSVQKRSELNSEVWRNDEDDRT